MKSYTEQQIKGLMDEIKEMLERFKSRARGSKDDFVFWFAAAEGGAAVLDKIEKFIEIDS